MAVEVMRTMASRGLTICGSGTVSTRTSFLPCQVNARMSLLLVDGLFGRERRGGNLAGLHELLEAAQLLARLDLRFAPEYLGEQLAERAGRRVVGDGHGHDGAAAVGRFAELHATAVIDVASFDGAPRDERAR